jgi:hypothetical protein
MATIDHREMSESGSGFCFGIEVALKIWHWSKTMGTFELNTRIDRPHQRMKVTSLSFAPASIGKEKYLLLTSGENGMLRTWGLETPKAAKRADEDGGFDDYSLLVYSRYANHSILTLIDQHTGFPDRHSATDSRFLRKLSGRLMDPFSLSPMVRVLLSGNRWVVT